MRRHFVNCKIENELSEEFLKGLRDYMNVMWVESIEKFLAGSNMTVDEKLIFIDRISEKIKNYSLSNNMIK